MKKSLENLIEFQPPTQAGTICAEILEKFSNDPDLLTIPIVSSERPVGLVNRHEFIQAMAHQYGRALYDRQLDGCDRCPDRPVHHPGCSGLYPIG